MQTAIVKQPSQLSLIPSGQQKNSIADLIKVVHKSDDPQLAGQLIRSFGGRKLKDLDMGNEQDKGTVISTIGYIRSFVGCIKDVDTPQIHMEADFLHTNYGELTFEGPDNDLINALTLLSTGKLDMKLSYILNFSCLFLGQILDSYLRRKRTEINKLGAETYGLAEEAPPVSLEDRLLSMKDNIRKCHQHFMDGFNERFFNVLVYDFLRKTKRLIFNDALIEEAKQYAQKKYTTLASPLRVQTVKSVVDGSKKEKDRMIRQFCIDFSLSKYFESLDLEEMLDGITLEEYDRFVQSEKK
jgi:hypothetical protein